MKRVLWLVVMLLLFVFSSCGGDNSEDNAPSGKVITLSLVGSSATVAAGDEYVLTVRVENAVNLFQCGFRIQYDPSVVEFEALELSNGTTKSVLLGDESENDVYVFPRGDELRIQGVVNLLEDGYVPVVLSRKRATFGTEGFTGGGDLVYLKFKALQPGQVTFSLYKQKEYVNFYSVNELGVQTPLNVDYSTTNSVVLTVIESGGGSR